MREMADFRALVERTHRIGRQRAVAHRRDIEHRRRIGLGAGRPTDSDAETVGANGARRHRVCHPLKGRVIGFKLCAERALVELALGALIDYGALVAGKRNAVGVALEEILPYFRADAFEQEPQVRRDRIVAQHRMPGLDQVAQADQRKKAADHQRNGADAPPRRFNEHQGGAHGCDDNRKRQQDEARLEGRKKQAHERSLDR